LTSSIHHLFDAVKAIAVQGYDEQRKVIYWNKGSELLYGYSQSEAMGNTLESLIIPPEIHDDVIQAHKNWVDKGIPIKACELVLQGKNGEEVRVYSSHVMFQTENNKMQMYCIDINLGEIHSARAQVAEKDNLLTAVLEATPDLFFVMQEDTTILSYHANSADQLYAPSEDIIGRKMAQILPSEVSNKLVMNIERSLAQDSVIEFGYELQVPTGVEYFEARARHLKDDRRVVLVVRNITQQHEANETIKKQAYFDTLTQLPNRFLALDRLSQIINDAERTGDRCAVLFIDLDDFKKVNDSLGHDVGDKLLIESALRLKSTVRKRDTVGRLGGDEFILILPEIKEHSGLVQISENLLNAFRKAFHIDGRALTMTLSIGVAAYPQNGTTAKELLRNADTAMYQAKATGRNGYSFFTTEMNTQMTRRLALEEQMRNALKRDEFSLHFQTKLNTHSGKIVGAEALLRWNNQILGRIGPDEFIPIAEGTGLIIAIGEFVIMKSLEFLAQWSKGSDSNDLHIAVNLSPRQFRDKNLVNFVRKALFTHKIPAHKLEFEITEGVLLSGQKYVKETLNELSKMGVMMSMDDFGTGYSSLSYLRQYSFDILKIDRSFVDGIVRNSADQKLVIATIAMAHSLGLKVVAEGVETEEQYALLKELKCDFVQGFYFSKPQPADLMLKS
jgi:diguanylate cyclase (GGDEF)-like protein/PAS domain S-box-containing protein